MDIPQGTCPNVLKSEHCRTLNIVLQEAANTRELIKACKDCNIPVEEGESENASQIDYASKIKARFFPMNQ